MNDERDRNSGAFGPDGDAGYERTPDGYPPLDHNPIRAPLNQVASRANPRERIEGVQSILRIDLHDLPTWIDICPAGVDALGVLPLEGNDAAIRNSA